MTERHPPLDLNRTYPLGPVVVQHQALTFTMTSDARPLETISNVGSWTPEAVRALRRLQSALPDQQRLPHRALAKRLEQRLPQTQRLKTGDSLWLALERGAPSPFVFALGRAQDTARVVQRIGLALRDWLQDDISPSIGQANEEAQAAVRTLLELRTGNQLFELASRPVRLWPWAAHDNGTATPTEREGYPLLADFLARQLEGKELFPGRGPMYRIVPQDYKDKEVELITAPVTGENFSLVVSLKVVSIPGLNQPLINLDVHKRRWVNTLKDPWNSSEVSGYVLPLQAGRLVAFQFALEPKWSVGQQRKYMPGEAFHALQRALGLPAGLSAVDIVAGSASTEEWQVLVNYRAGTAPRHPIGGGVPEADKLDAFDAVSRVFQPLGLLAGVPLQPLATRNKLASLSGQITSIASKANGAALTKRLDGTVNANQEALKRHHPEHPEVILLHGQDLGPETQEAIQVVQEVMGGHLRVTTVELPPGVHGLRTDLPNAEEGNVEKRGQARLSAWQARTDRLAVLSRGRPVVGCLVLAAKFYNGKPEDRVNKVAGRKALARIGLPSQYLLPLNPQKRHSAADYRTRAENALRDLVWKHHGRIDGLQEAAAQSFAPGTEPGTILGVSVLQTTNTRNSHKGSTVPVVFRHELASGRTSMRYIREVGGQVKLEPWRPLPEALTELAGHTPAPIRGKDRQQQAFQELCRTVITEACAAGERPLVLIHSTTSVNLWKWLADARIDPDHIDLDALGNGLGYEQLWKEARIVRVRPGNAPQVVIRKEQEVLEQNTVLTRLALPTSPNPGLYRLALPTRLPTYLSIGGKLGRKTKKGTSCHESRPLIKKPKGEARIRGFGVLEWRPPDTGNWPTPNPIELLLVQLQVGDDEDAVATFVERLRSGYGHHHEWSSLPAPLSFESAARDYIIGFEDEDPDRSEEQGG